MAIQEHVSILRSGVQVWNLWREQNPQILPDLSNANLAASKLKNANLEKVNLRGTSLWVTDLTEANLREADLSRSKCVAANFSHSCAVKAKLNSADFTKANLEGINLSEAGLSGSDFYGANLKNANLEKTDLRRTIFSNANLSGANLESAYLLGTIFGDTNLSDVKNIELCLHIGPSVLDYQTIERSGTLPESFAIGCGLPGNFIDSIRPLIKESRQFYKCFISYSTLDNSFVKLFIKDLRAYGVKYWFAPRDMRAGSSIKSAINQAITVLDKVLLILSESSIASQWVEYEAKKALEKEQKISQDVLLPIMIDDSILSTDVDWASSLKNTRNIGNFCDWKNHNSYKQAFDLLLRDLRIAWKQW
ncbi:MAG: toll/interleukin-1 receptor domain-containing protein [Candidatus Pacebacteria bacterium]|nr:toll/interleukin-1 receptor domain-containing protein [Candidatus Paceibacterota bacterium]